ncbi:hypothetical protein MMC30_006354 [Trapelia coarctata]|nr:hypothetical protein [Trapelia coarctata]
MDTVGTSHRPLVNIDEDEEQVLPPATAKSPSHVHTTFSHPESITANLAKASPQKPHPQRLSMGPFAAGSRPKAAVQTSSNRGPLKSNWQFPASTKTTSEPLLPSAILPTIHDFSQPRSSEVSGQKFALPRQPASAKAVQRTSGKNTMSPNSSFVHPPRYQSEGRNHQRQMMTARRSHAGLPGSLIDLSGDDETADRSDVAMVWDAVRNSGNSRPSEPDIQRLREDSLSDHHFELWLAEQARAEQRRTQSISLVPSNRRCSLDKYIHDGFPLCSNVNVELADGDFMRIDRLLHDPTTKEVFLSGWRFRRMRFMNGIAEKKLNEVCWIMHVNKSDPRDLKQQCLHETSVTQVIKRRTLKLTNQTFPALSWREDTSTWEPRDVIEHDRRLVCRWKYICTYADDKAQKNNLHCEKALVRLRENESDKGCGCGEEHLREVSRGETAIGGSSSTVGSVESEQLEKERRLTRNAAATLRRQTIVPGMNSTSSARSVVFGPRADAPLDLDSLDAPSEGNVRSPHGFHSQNTRALPTRIPIASTRYVVGSSNKRLLLQSTGPTRTCPPVDLTVDDDIDLGFRFITLDQCIGGQDRSLNSATLGPSFRRRVSSSDIIDVDARITTSSKRGMTERYWEGQISTKRSLVVKDSISAGKRNHQSAFGAPATERSFSQELNLRNKSYEASLLKSKAPSPLLSPAKSDSTLGKERSPSLVLLDEDNEAQKPLKKRRKISSRWSGSAIGSSAARKPSMNSGSMSKALQRYTFGDGFCGCGGVSRGARIAGLHLKWSFDFEQDMCDSYQINFPEAHTMCLSAFDFATKNSHGFKVDILHLSPPCQFFSPAHTTAGQNDELNTASSFVISELLRKTQPRVVTLENTMGLEQRHPLYLNAVIQQFTILGFSIRWKVIDLRDFGVPQSRRRLILIAAGPGETLPEFPGPSHSNDPQKTGLQPWATINQSIDSIPANWANHDVRLATPTSYPPFDGNSQARTMTCSGGVNNHHPSGKRDYTVREYASLQTFPLEHCFADITKTIQKKQIGNAVPPVFAKCLFEHLVRSLRETDGISDSAAPADRTLDTTAPRDTARPSGASGSRRAPCVVID